MQDAVRFIVVSENPKPVYGVVVVLIVANWFGDPVRRVLLSNMEPMSALPSKVHTVSRLSRLHGRDSNLQSGLTITTCLIAQTNGMKMNRWIALFRGINVGGNNLLPMATLSRYLEAIQLTNIKTYIQSGNVVFDSKSKSSKSIQKAIIRKIDEEHSFCPQLLLLRQWLLASVTHRRGLDPPAGTGLGVRLPAATSSEPCGSFWQSEDPQANRNKNKL